jgi:hypothetical protein
MDIFLPRESDAGASCFQIIVQLPRLGGLVFSRELVPKVLIYL